MYVTYDVNQCDHIQIVAMSISSSTNYNKILMFKRYPSYTLNLLDSLSKGTAPSAWYQKIGRVILYISLSTTVQKFLAVLEITVQVSFEATPVTPWRGYTGTNGRVNIFKKFILNNFCSIMLCKIFVVFEIWEVKNVRFWPLKTLIT